MNIQALFPAVSWIFYKIPIKNSPPAIIGEFPVEKFVHQYQLNDDVHEAEEFTEPITNCVQFMALKEI